MVAVQIAEADSSTAARYEALIRISNSIRARKEPRDLFEILVQELRKVISFDAIAQFDESSNKINWHLGPSCHDRDGCPDDLERGESLPRMVFRTQETVVLSARDGAARFPEFTRKMCGKGLQSVCALPLTTAHRRLGSLLIGSTQPNAYSQKEVEFCTLVADQIALATDDALNFEASRKAQERLELLLDLTNRVVSNLNLRDVLREISAQVRRVMHCEGAGILLPDGKDGKLRIYALDYPDAPHPLTENFEPPDDAFAPVRAFRAGEPIVESGEEIQSEGAGEVRMKTVAHVPMAGRNGIVGVLSLGTHDEGVFSPDDLPFLTQVAHQVAIAIENARAFGEISDQREQLALEKLYLEDELRTVL